MSKPVRTSAGFRFFSAGFAFIVWGGWAYAVNVSHSYKHGVISGLAQGIVSAAVTLLMVHVVTFLYHRFEKPVFKLVLPGLLTVMFTTSCTVLIHAMVGTPRIFFTILPAFTVGFLFCLYTCNQLRTLDGQPNEQEPFEFEEGGAASGLPNARFKRF